MPILGILASQISGHLFAPTGAYDSLATVTVPSGGLTSLTFAGIPTGYKHLQIRYIARSGTGSSTDSVALIFNGDSSASYAYHVIYGNGTSALATATTSGTNAKVGQLALSSTVFAPGIIDILDYSSSTKNKTIRCLSGADFNGSGVIALESNLWVNTSPVTSITISYGGTYAQYSQFALYGVK